MINRPGSCLKCQSKLAPESTLIEGTVLQLYISQFTLLARLSITCFAPLSAAQSFLKNQIIHGARKITQSRQLSVLIHQAFKNSPVPFTSPSPVRFLARFP